MAMDRKNKKAAQTAAASGTEKGKSGKGGKKDTVGSGCNLLAGGSTAPTRILNTSSGSSKSARVPINMPLKASISPSAPAPALKDADFASFTTLDDLEGLQQNPNASQDIDKTLLRESTKEIDTSAELSKRFQVSDGFAEPIPLPPSAPRPSAITIVNDFGPIGSPPNYRTGQPISPIPTNGTSLSPAMSPRNPSIIVNHGSSLLSNTPLSAPGTQEHFISSSFSMRGGIAASLGSGMAMIGGRRGLEDHASVMPCSFSGLLSGQHSSSTSQNFGLNGPNNFRGEYDVNIESQRSETKSKATQGMDSAVEDEELGDFLPSSLNDLLTPEEKSRRMSRSNSQKPSGISHLTSALANVGSDSPIPGDTNGFRDEASTSGDGNGNLSLAHRHSRSVPACNLLGEIKSIWADTTTNPPSPHHGAPGTFASVLGNGNSRADEVGLGMSISSAGATPSSGMIGPSNASAAFLPSLHKHYMDSKAKQMQLSQLGHSRGFRGANNPLLSNSLASNYSQPLGGVGSASNPSGLHSHMHGNTTTTYWASSSPFDLTKVHQPHSHLARPIPSNLLNQASKPEDPLLAPTLLSPGSRALQSHAPGQSLPQGLAAGYSRIHALPPLVNIASPPSGSLVAGSSPAGKTLSGNTEGFTGELTSSKLQYSATATLNVNGGLPTVYGAPPGLARNISGGKYVQPLSPPNRPIMINYDEIFQMDK